MISVIWADPLNYDLLNHFCIKILNGFVPALRLIRLCAMAMLLYFTWHESVHAQHTSADHFVNFQSIDDAEKKGLLSRDQAILQKLNTAFRSDSADPSYIPQTDDQPYIKCMVPLAAEIEYQSSDLQTETLQQASLMMQQMSRDTEFSYDSPSGKFRLHYDTTGRDAVPAAQKLPGAIEEAIPDYIYKAAAAADSSYRYQVQQLGFSDFTEAGTYDMYFRSFGFYGTTTISGSTTYITIHSTFNGFPENSHPEGNQTGALYATIAHEIKHAIQYKANRWRESAGSFNWIEMDATLMEEIVHDDVNDYYNYIKKGFQSDEPSSSSIFGSPQTPTPGAYYHVSWMLYFAETYGMAFWKDTWDLVSEQPLIPFTDAIQETLNERGDAFAGAHLQNHLWHLASGQRFTDTNFGFREREFYPNPDIRHNLTTIPDSASGTGLRPLAANYLRAEPMNLTIGHPGIQLRSTAPGTGVGLIGLFNDGSTKVVSGINESGGTYSLQTDWNWNHLSELYLAVVNTNQSQSSDYTVTLQSEVPERDILAQNYPNPFNPATRIEFSISADKHVRLDVYDSVGRRVQTLVNQSLNEGFHTVEFDGSALSSGVYFYRIITDNQTITNKMMLIK